MCDKTTHCRLQKSASVTTFNRDKKENKENACISYLNLNAVHLTVVSGIHFSWEICLCNSYFRLLVCVKVFVILLNQISFIVLGSFCHLT